MKRPLEIEYMRQCRYCRGSGDAFDQYGNDVDAECSNCRGSGYFCDVCNLPMDECKCVECDEEDMLKPGECIPVELVPAVKKKKARS